MAKHYCTTHGEHRDDDGCPACREAETRSQEAHRELLESLSEISEQSARDAEASAEAARHAAYLTNNPGDFECPACLMKSLKRNASRCPLCRSDVPDDFWERVQERERQAAERMRQAEEKRQKWLASPEYAKEQEDKRLAAASAARTERENRLKGGARGFALAVGLIGAFYGALYGASSGITHAEKMPHTGLSDGLGNLFGGVVGGLIVGGGGGFIIVAAVAWVLASIVVGIINALRS